MPVTSAKCPECGAKLRFPKPVAAGKKIKLVEMTKDPNKSLRFWRASLIGAIGPPMTEQALPVLRGLLKDKEKNVVNTAIQQLAKYGPAAKVAIPDLQEVTRRLPFSFVKFEAEQMIKKLEAF